MPNRSVTATCIYTSLKSTFSGLQQYFIADCTGYSRKCIIIQFPVSH